MVGVTETKDGHDDLGHVAAVVGPGHVLDAGGRGTDGCCELEGLADRKMGEVLVDLLVVDELALEFLDHLVLGDAIVVDSSLFVEMKTVKLSTDALQERTASRTGPAEDHEEFTTLEKAVEVVKNLLGLGLAEREDLARTEE